MGGRQSARFVQGLLKMAVVMHRRVLLCIAVARVLGWLATSGPAVNLFGRTMVRLFSDPERSRALRERAAAELPEGAKRPAIEAFLDRNGITYVYNEQRKRYQGIIRDVSPILNQAVTVKVYLKESEELEKIVIDDSFW
jgi:hypothetical protein